MNHGQDANYQGTISALDLESGDVRWRFDRPHWFAEPVIDTDGAVLVTGFDGFAHRIGPDGALQWSVQVSDRNLGSGQLCAGRYVFSEIAGQARNLWALNARTGAIDWRYEHGGHGYGLAIQQDRSVIVSTSSGGMYDPV